MNLVELELDETLADFEVQDWIDNVFSVQYPDVKARIKKGCSGLCHKKDEWHYVKDEGTPKVEGHYLVYLRNKDKDIFDCWIYYDKDVGWYSMKVRMKDIYAWKEIVLPELKEE